MRNTLLLCVAALLATASSQEYGQRIGRVGQTNGYFYPQPSPTFTLPPATPPPTARPTPPPVAPVVQEPEPNYLPPAPEPPTTTTTTRRPTTTTTTTTTTPRPTTTTARPTPVPVRTTTAPPAEYLPPVETTTRQPQRPTTTEGYDYPVPENPLTPGGSSNNQVAIRPTTKAPPRVEPVVSQDDEIAFWDFRESIAGEPEIDYPIFEKVPETSFTCAGKLDGYYADIEARCQAFHVCSNVPEAEPVKNSFLCPNGTIFNQEGFACQWWHDVECTKSSQFYELNANIGKVPEPSSGSAAASKGSAGSITISAGAGASSSSGFQASASAFSGTSIKATAQVSTGSRQQY